MSTDLEARLHTLSRGDTTLGAPPPAGIAQRLEMVRRALCRQAPPDPGADHLLLCLGGSAHWVVLAGTTVIGAAPDADLRPASKYVSAHHCRLTQGADGWVVEDLASRNGVLVNGQRVTRYDLCDGDAIQLADVTLILVGRVDPEEP